MYNDEWKPVMTADSMEERIEEFADLARKRADQQDKEIEAVVHDLTHDAYLLKHTTSDALSELQTLLGELQDIEETYPDAFYDGEANDHITSYLEDLNAEFWYDYVYLSLAAGLEWAVLAHLEEATTVESE